MRRGSRDEELIERAETASELPGSSRTDAVVASTSTATANARRTDVRRSLKELRQGMSRNLESLVARQGMERISETQTVESPPARTIESERPSLFERLQRTIDELPSLPNMSGEGSVVERIDTTLNAHYYTVAYGVVITAYVIGFAEYVYLRLMSLIIPEKMKFYRTSDGKTHEVAGKDGFHYGASIGAFVVIALFQLICFFGLTISEKWTKISHFGPASAASLRRERLASQIRFVIHTIMYRTFLCYGICSGIICLIIFYIVGIQDSIGDTLTTVFTYVFDGLMCLYFLAFPLCTIIYHPHVYCFKSRPTENADAADSTLSTGAAPLVHNSTATRLAEGLESAEYSALPIPSAIPPLRLPNGMEREPRPGSASHSLGSSSRPDSRSPRSAREPPNPPRDPPFQRGLRITTTV